MKLNPPSYIHSKYIEPGVLGAYVPFLPEKLLRSSEWLATPGKDMCSDKTAVRCLQV
jgi:hypothetical protein